MASDPLLQHDMHLARGIDVRRADAGTLLAGEHDETLPYIHDFLFGAGDGTGGCGYRRVPDATANTCFKRGRVSGRGQARGLRGPSGRARHRAVSLPRMATRTPPTDDVPLAQRLGYSGGAFQLSEWAGFLLGPLGELGYRPGRVRCADLPRCQVCVGGAI